MTGGTEDGGPQSLPSTSPQYSRCHAVCSIETPPGLLASTSGDDEGILRLETAAEASAELRRSEADTRESRVRESRHQTTGIRILEYDSGARQRP